jgi:hypothetical protein
MERKKVKVQTETEEMQVSITKDEFFDIAAEEVSQFLTFIQKKFGTKAITPIGDMLTTVIGEIAIRMFKED